MFSTFHTIVDLLISVSLSPLSNKAAYGFLTELQREIGVKFLPPNFQAVLKKLLNRFMKDVKVERVKFKVNFITLYCWRKRLWILSQCFALGYHQRAVLKVSVHRGDNSSSMDGVPDLRDHNNFWLASNFYLCRKVVVKNPSITQPLLSWRRSTSRLSDWYATADARNQCSLLGWMEVIIISISGGGIITNKLFTGGDQKLVCSLFLHDLDNPKTDKGQFKEGGWRKSLLLAEADYCQEVN